MHGDRDGVIPFAPGQRLFTAARGPKRFFTIAGGDHNEVDPPPRRLPARGGRTRGGRLAGGAMTHPRLRPCYAGASGSTITAVP